MLYAQTSLMSKFSLLLQKSVIARGLLEGIAEKENIVPVLMNFSAQTSSKRVQEILEGKLEKKRKTILGKYSILCKYDCKRLPGQRK